MTKLMTKKMFEKGAPKSITPAPPRLPQELEPFATEQLEQEGRYSELSFGKLDFRAQCADQAKLENCKAVGTNFSETELRSSRLIDVEFDRCTIMNADWHGVTLRRAHFDICSITALKLVESKLQDVVFKGCKGPLSSFRFAKLETVTFDECILTEADFYSTEFVNVVFVNCDLQQADFSRSKLKGIDLRTSKIEGIKAGPAELTGAIIDPAQAIVLARAMGLDVRLGST